MKTDLLPWPKSLAHDFCCLIEQDAPSLGFHVALTGGCLYKGGETRKDCDVVLYRIRQETEDFLAAKARLLIRFAIMHSIIVRGDYGFVVKCEWRGHAVDFLFPESSDKTSYPANNPG